ncbi:ferredoxin [Rhodococcus sp. LB1]|nr:ferredoxin [Rhodococcus sp. LB1]
MTQIENTRVGSTSVTMKLTEYEADVLVESKKLVADGVVLLVLRHTDGEQLPAWEPGAHIDLVLPGDTTRQYSLMGDPDDRQRWKVGVLREPESRGGSEYIHDQLVEGQTVRVRGPRNHFELATSNRYHFIAGGIGITPMIPMIRSAQTSGAEWKLTYGGRQRSSMAFLDDLEQHGDKVDVFPQDTRGFPDLDAILSTLAPGTQVYCCGPEGLLTAVEDKCAQWKVGDPHIERFSPKHFDDAVNTAFDVELRESGLTLHVPADQSILQVVRAAGVGTTASCEEGTCGTCETGVHEGTPDHRDSVLTADEQAENDYMMICVSRSCSKKLVLEL